MNKKTPSSLIWLFDLFRISYCSCGPLKMKTKMHTQTLWWQGVEIARSSEEYQVLLDRAFDALAQNSGFRTALLATGNSVLTHSIGKTKITETVLTRQEFCSRLTKIREELRKEM